MTTQFTYNYKLGNYIANNKHRVVMIGIHTSSNLVYYTFSNGQVKSEIGTGKHSIEVSHKENDILPAIISITESK